ncbi:MAG TPA: asparagine synthase-related protein [Caulobacteraceae bacterium]|jgi:asparagine synthase (glutamine-hydrolysing)
MDAIRGLFQRAPRPLTARERGFLGLRGDAGEQGSPCWLAGGAGVEAGPDDGRFVAAGALRNRRELTAELGPAADDAALMRLAWLRWGEAAPERLIGDWCFAAWRPDARRLVLVRDQFGATPLYYVDAGATFAFASSRQALARLAPAPRELDELYLARVLIGWPAPDGGATAERQLRRLPPAHVLAATPGGAETRVYWRLEETPQLRLPRREDYVRGFLEVFDRAVGECLPASGAVGAMLSGGLDSGAVAATAAGLLGAEGRRLDAFTSVPLGDTRPYVGRRFGDELPLARATADAAGIDLHPIDAAGLTPIAAIRAALDLAGEPLHATANLYWMIQLGCTAAAMGCQALLVGQMGNGAVSWQGDPASQPPTALWRAMGPRTRLRQLLGALKPYALQTRSWRRQAAPDPALTALAPELARRLDLVGRWEASADALPPRSPREAQLRTLGPARSFGGALQAELAPGVPIRDPTADPRVLAYCLSAPDRVFIDPGTGLDRWLIRAAMAGRLPDEVRLNRRRGRQAGDLVPRLRACADEVEASLDEVAAGAAAEYLDIGRLRFAWAGVRAEDSPAAHRLAAAVLLRGLMAGLFVNGFGKPPAGAD